MWSHMSHIFGIHLRQQGANIWENCSSLEAEESLLLGALATSAAPVLCPRFVLSILHLSSGASTTTQSAEGILRVYIIIMISSVFSSHLPFSYVHCADNVP